MSFFPGFPVFSRREMDHFSRFPAGNSKPGKCATLILPTTFLLNAFQATFSGLLNERIYDYGKTPVKDCVVLKIRERTSVDFAYPIKFYPIW